jgi:hypothetical protein
MAAPYRRPTRRRKLRNAFEKGNRVQVAHYLSKDIVAWLKNFSQEYRVSQSRVLNDALKLLRLKLEPESIQK